MAFILIVIPNMHANLCFLFPELDQIWTLIVLTDQPQQLQEDEACKRSSIWLVVVRGVRGAEQRYSLVTAASAVDDVHHCLVQSHASLIFHIHADLPEQMQKQRLEAALTALVGCSCGPNRPNADSSFDHFRDAPHDAIDQHVLCLQMRE